MRSRAEAEGGVVDLLRSEVLSGRYAVGERLTEAGLAHTLGVSRTPVREALQRLAVEGLVDLHPNRGARVAGWTEEQLDEIYGLRTLLESYGARLAAPRITGEEIEDLEGLAGEMEVAARSSAPNRLDRVAALNNRFHVVIMKTGGNQRLSGILSSLAYVPLVYRTFHRYNPEALQRSFSQHRELIDAFRARDAAWAEAVMRAHLLAARRVLGSGSDGPGGANGPGSAAPA